MATKNGTIYNDNGTTQNGIYYPILTGTNGDDQIYGLAGNDILDGGAGNDSLYGDKGNDLLLGGDGNDYLFGGDGNDTLVGNRGADRFLGGAGNDLLIWNNGDGSDRISGETGYDTVQVNGAGVGDNFRLQRNAQGQAVFDRLNLVPFTLTVDSAEKFEINGLGGDDILDVNSLAGTGVNLVEFTGGAGNDWLDGSGTETTLRAYGNDGNDTLTGGSAHDSLYGDAGKDLLQGGDGNDYLSGGHDDDTLIGNRGADRFLGGAGNDLLIWNNGDGSDRISGETGYDTVQVNGAGVGDNFRLQRNSQGQAIFDRLNLVPFTLTVDSAEKFQINGLGGDDILDVNNLAGTGVDLVEFSGGEGNDTLNASDSSTRIFAKGDAGNDLLTGSSANDTLNGGDGHDFVEGEKGNDTMIGGAGNDTLAWDDGDGSDRISGNHGIDTIEVEGSVTLGDKFVLGQQGNLAIFDRVNLVPFKLTVDTAEQFSVSGEGGNDSLDVNNLSYTGVNWVSFSGGYGNDTLDGSDTSTRLLGNGDAGNDLLIGGSAHDTLNGGDGDDKLYGKGGNDLLSGGNGNDYIVGGYGADTLYGGAGADKFAFTYVAEGIDIIKDFQKNWSQPSLSDKIEISKVGFGASSLSQFHYDSYSGGLSFQGTQFAILENKPTGFSTTTDIILV
ncbi:MULTISPECIES: calcium-binding protein [Calothrix]|uniref:Calcium-binding protein n=2 Tax=Calothrix TaxID=1186 RepID=A0ABR8A9N0_9CYAN|nr:MULTISPECIES: calcium-binding protein [Calothrix]MBD2196559.1 calcium-binding protein [Calothrix parietina FACHB-288]MBD2227399.1 calcium-binding protein [Calothrix anomala FACHB-343]